MGPFSIFRGPILIIWDAILVISHNKTTMAVAMNSAASGGAPPLQLQPGNSTEASTPPSANAGKGTIDGEDRPGDAPFAALPFHGEHKRAVSSLSFAPPGAGGTGAASRHGGGTECALCASASADGTARVWDVARSINLAESPRGGPPGSPKRKKARRPSGSRLEPTTVLEGHSRGINDVAWSPRANYLATASDDRTLRLWSAETGDACVEFRGHSSFVFACKFNPQSNLLVSGVSGS